MKKTLITAAAVLGFVGAAFAETTYTLGDVTYTTQTAKPTATGNKFGTVKSFTFTLTDDMFANSDTDAFWTTASDGSDSYNGSVVALTSLTLTQAQNQNLANRVPGLTIKDEEGKILATTTAGQYSSHTNDVSYAGGSFKRDQLTWDFEGTSVQLTVGKTYTIELSSGGHNDSLSLSAYEAGTGNGFGSITTTNGTTQAGWIPADMTIVTTSLVANTATVPEPATATLSLLALAGLAARRRRK